MSVFQIIAVCVLSVGVLTAIGFTVAFVVESLKKETVKEESKFEKVADEEVSEIDLDAMLAKLEEVSTNKKVKVEEQVQEPEVVIVEEVKEESNLEVVADDVKEEVQEEVTEETNEIVEETQEVVEEVKDEPVQEPTITIINNITAEKKGPEFDYRVRLEKIKESQAKIDRDLDKTTRAILKYERTIRRKERNQKMLDRRALELTNLNLLMYSVTDIKNVDAEKKTRQEELTKHIAELKASIQDAENYLEANKEKHENNLKLRDYLSHEKTRYADEVKELETAIASGKYFDDNTDGTNAE